MCSIAGIVGFGGGEASSLFDRALAHRGPDGSGKKLFNSTAFSSCHGGDGEIMLVHRRLAILDLGPLAAQPMGNADGRHWLVYNGEIYNHRELRSSFSDADFRTNSDTETLLRLLERDGVACLDSIRGMYAFA